MLWSSSPSSSWSWSSSPLPCQQEHVHKPKPCRGRTRTPHYGSLWTINVSFITVIIKPWPILLHIGLHNHPVGLENICRAEIEENNHSGLLWAGDRMWWKRRQRSWWWSQSLTKNQNLHRIKNYFKPNLIGVTWCKISEPCLWSDLRDVSMIIILVTHFGLLLWHLRKHHLARSLIADSFNVLGRH